MLSREHRIGREDFPQGKAPRFFSSPLLSLKFFPRRGVKKVSVVVSKKAIQTAVARNKTKRTIYNIAQNLLPRIPEGLHIFFVKGGIVSATKKEIEREIEKSFTHIAPHKKQ